MYYIFISPTKHRKLICFSVNYITANIRPQVEISKYKTEYVSTVCKSNFDKLNEGERSQKGATKGNTYDIKSELGKIALFILFGGDW